MKGYPHRTLFDAGILFSTNKVKYRPFHVYEMGDMNRMLKVKKFKTIQPHVDNTNSIITCEKRKSAL